MDSMMVEVEMNEESLTEDMVQLNRMTSQLASRMKEILNIKADVRLVLPGTLERFEGKGKHVVDNRKYD